MEAPSLGLYVAASLALIITPGQDMVYVVTRALAQGRLAGVCSAIGVCLGILLHTALAAIGVGAILHASEGAFLALKLAGAAYLAYLGIRLLLSREALDLANPAAGRLSPVGLVVQGMLSNVTNPKIVLFFLAFLPQFVSPGEGATRELVSLGVLYAVLALPVKAGVAVAAGSLAQAVARKPGAIAWLHRVSGLALVLLGLRLAATPR